MHGPICTWGSRICIYVALCRRTDSTEAFFLINAEMRAIRQAVLQNRMALDLLLAHEGGVCQVLNTSCCFSIPDYYENITDLIWKDAVASGKPYVQLWFMVPDTAERG
uniref:Uncharacterized protein n=1 Tax=Astyanax mexicanus TaxID=7994 RepID=A0A3B1K527_ASTMX